MLLMSSNGAAHDVLCLLFRDGGRRFSKERSAHVRVLLQVTMSARIAAQRYWIGIPYI